MCIAQWREDQEDPGKQCGATQKEVGVAQSYALFDQDTKIIRELQTRRTKIQTLLDMGGLRSMFKLKEFIELGFKSKKLETTHLKDSLG